MFGATSRISPRRRRDRRRDDNEGRHAKRLPAEADGLSAQHVKHDYKLPELR